MRQLALDAEFRRMRTHRLARPEIREERLRTTVGLRGDPTTRLSAWRGRSGRRYVVTVRDDHGLIPGIVRPEEVSLVVRREPDGQARILGIATGDRPESWWMGLSNDGANEVHVHRLAATDQERAAIAADLSPPEPMNAATPFAPAGVGALDQQ